MTRPTGQFGQEFIDKLLEFYLENPISLNELSDRSFELFGTRIDRKALAHYATLGRWGVLKQRAAHGKSGLPDSVTEEINDLREQVFDTIMNPEDIPSARDLSSLVTAYMNLQGAGSVKIGTAKTSLQQVLDTAEKVLHGRTDDIDD